MYFLIIILIGFMVFANSLFNSFVLDDPSQIAGNPAVHSLKNIPSLFWGSSFGGGVGLEGVYYKPLMTTYYTVIYSLFGPNPFFYHLLQVILHIANACLLFVFLNRFFPANRNLPLFISLVFLVHPINAEPVIYISNLQDPLFFFWGILSLVIISKKSLTQKDYYLTSLTLFLSTISKETGVLFLGLILAYVFLFRRNNLLKFIVINCSVFVTYLLIRYFAVGFPYINDKIFPISRLDFIDRMISVPAIVFYYLKTFFYPKDLSVAQMWVVQSPNFRDFYLPLLISLIGLIGLIGLIWKTRSKKLLFFSSWLIIGLGLHLHFIPLDATVADRWFYFPIVGMLGILGLGLLKLLKYPKLLIIIMVFLLLALSVRTIIRNSNFKDGLTLALHDIQASKDSFALENNLGFELIQAVRYDEAQIHIENSTRLAPYWWLNWNNLGVVYRHKAAVNEDHPEYLVEAQQAFRNSIRNTTSFYMPYENLAELLLNFKTPEETKQFIIDSSNRIRLNDRLVFLLSLAEYKLGNIDKAIEYTQTAYTLNPNNTLSAQLHQALINNQQIEIRMPDY